MLAELAVTNDAMLPCSRMLVFKVNETTLVKMAMIDPSNQRIGCKFALESGGDARDDVLWVGLSSHGLAQLYAYNKKIRELRELEDKRRSTRVNSALKLHRLDGMFYFIGKNYQLMCLTLDG